MPFEPNLPNPWQFLFSGDIQATVTDPNGVPAGTIISLQDIFTLTVNWQMNGLFVPSIGGTWHIAAYVESIGPGLEGLIAAADIPMNGGNNYSRVFNINPMNLPNGLVLTAGVYQLVTVLTATNLLNTPAPFAGYVEGPILQFFEGPSL